MFYAACMFYGTAFMYNHAILCIFSPILEVEINIIIIPYIFRIWTKVTIGLTVSCLNRLFRAPKTRHGGGLHSPSASCFLYKTWWWRNPLSIVVISLISFESFELKQFTPFKYMLNCGMFAMCLPLQIVFIILFILPIFSPCCFFVLCTFANFSLLCLLYFTVFQVQIKG